jgi:hypothetical protein
MAYEAQLKILRKGAAAWNAWRKRHLRTKPQLSQADLIGADLRAANLSEADLFKADLRKANLSRADLSRADLSRTDLTGACLQLSILVQTNLSGATLDGCHVYGISVWDITCDGATQSDLVITPPGQAMIQVDNLEVAQFIYLILNNQKLRDVIETIARKVVLILGNFSPRRKIVLDAVREELRRRGYLPVLFDFEGPQRRDLTETISTLAHLARFVIADVTDPRSVPAELVAIVPHLSVPGQTLLLASEQPHALLEDSSKYLGSCPISLQGPRRPHRIPRRKGHWRSRDEGYRTEAENLGSPIVRAWVRFVSP